MTDLPPAALAAARHIIEAIPVYDEDGNCIGTLGETGDYSEKTVEAVAYVIAHHYPHHPAPEGEAKLSLAEATMQKMVEVEQERAQEIAALRAECAALRSAVEGALELSDEDHARELSALRAEVAALRAAVGSAVDALCSEKRRRSGGEYHYPFDVVDAGVTVGMDALAAGRGERALACVRELIEAADDYTSGMGELGEKLPGVCEKIDAARRLFGSGSGAKEEGR